MAKSSEFDASASMLGYLYQIRYGLFLAMKKCSDVLDPDQFNISIEKLDDIAFDKEGSAEELLQTKFHGTSGNLTDRSPDIWKTIRVWVECIRSGQLKIGFAHLSLITTQSLPENSLASYLGSGEARNIVDAMKLMDEICEETNEVNYKGYQAYKTLTVAEKREFLNSIFVIGRSGDLLEVRTRMTSMARQSVPVQAIPAYLDRIEGTWFKWCVEALSQSPSDVINLGLLQELVEELRPQYSATNLPAEYSNAFPELLNIDKDMRFFIQQLRLFKAPNRMLELAVANYYRAYEQRNKWSIDGLLNPGELSKYDNKIYEKWQEQIAFQEARLSVATDEEKRNFALDLYQFCQQNGIIAIRPEFKEDYLSKGSYHILADELKIGWHPDFEKLKASNEDAA